MTEENELKLKNYMEEVVDRKLKELLQDRNDVCQCKHCRLDIMAIALNDLPPRYIVSEKGEVYSKVSSLISIVSIYSSSLKSIISSFSPNSKSSEGIITSSSPGMVIVSSL